MKAFSFLAGVLLAAGLGAAGWWYLHRASDPAPAEAPAWAAVSREDLEVTIEAMASVRPENRVEIRPAVAGRVEEVRVREGDRVQRGQVLALMSTTERAVLLDAARARGEAELAKWQEVYRPMPVLAPLDGEVIARNVEPGQTVGPESALLVVSDHLVVEALADETDLAQIRTGQLARIVLDAYPAEPLAGRVLRISHEARTVENVTVYGVLLQPERVPEFVRSGMTANVAFQVQRRAQVLVLPAEAVREDAAGAWVLAPAADPAAPPARKNVKTGISDGKRIEILDGLDEGDRVLVPRVQAPIARGAARRSPFVPSMPGRAERREP